MTPAAESKFVELVRQWIVSLPHDLKVAFEAMDDENLPRAARELAAGAIVYVVSPKEGVPDKRELVASFSDDAVLLRLALAGAAADQSADAFRERFEEVFGGLDEDLNLCRGVMGDLMPWLEKKLSALPGLEYKGKRVRSYLDDGEAREQLFEDGLVFRTDFPVDEDTIGDKLKKASTVLDLMRKKRAEEQRAGA